MAKGRVVAHGKTLVEQDALDELAFELGQVDTLLLRRIATRLRSLNSLAGVLFDDTEDGPTVLALQDYAAKIERVTSKLNELAGNLDG